MIILTSGLQVGCAHERPNTTAAALTCCSLYSFSSHIFCSVSNPPSQQAALHRASACHCLAPPEWPDCPRIVWQDNIDQKKGSKPSGALGKCWVSCHVRQYPSRCSGRNYQFISGPENWKWWWQWSSAKQYAWDIVPLPLSGADVKVTCTESYCASVCIAFGCCHSLSLAWPRTILNSSMLS